MRRAVAGGNRLRRWTEVAFLLGLLFAMLHNIHRFVRARSVPITPPVPVTTQQVVAILPPLPSPRIRRKAKYFVFHPYKRLTCARNLTKKYNLIAIKPEEGKDLFGMFNPAMYPYRHLFALLDAPAVELSRHYEEMGPALTTVPPFEVTSMCANKLAFNRWLHNEGLGQFAPKIYSNISSISAFPVIIKPLNGTGSALVKAAHSLHELESWIDRRLVNVPYLLQECILNRIQRIVHVTAIDGRMLRMVCYERDLEGESNIYPNKWRTTPPALNNSLCHEDLVRLVLRKLNFTGVGDFDIKIAREPDGWEVPKIIEFNPRIPGTVRRDEHLLADFICSLQFNGTGVLTNTGCWEPE